MYSSRKAAREGFTLALIRVLVAVPKVRTDAVVSKLQEAVALSAKLKGQEKRDAILGRLFGYLAVIRAGRFSAPQVQIICVSKHA